MVLICKQNYFLSNCGNIIRYRVFCCPIRENTGQSADLYGARRLDGPLILTLFYSGLTCTIEEPLLNGVSPVPDSYFTASSVQSATYAVYKARMDGGSGVWMPATTSSSFLQVRRISIVCVILFLY